MAQATATILGTGVLFYALGVKESHRHVALGGIVAGIYFVVSAWAAWFVYHARKVAVARGSSQS